MAKGFCYHEFSSGNIAGHVVLAVLVRSGARAWAKSSMTRAPTSSWAQA